MAIAIAKNSGEKTTKARALPMISMILLVTQKNFFALSRRVKIRI